MKSEEEDDDDPLAIIDTFVRRTQVGGRIDAHLRGKATPADVEADTAAGGGADAGAAEAEAGSRDQQSGGDAAGRDEESAERKEESGKTDQKERGADYAEIGKSDQFPVQGLSPSDVCDALGLYTIAEGGYPDVAWKCFGCSGSSGQGLYEAFDWLSRSVERRALHSLHGSSGMTGGASLAQTTRDAGANGNGNNSPSPRKGGELFSQGKFGSSAASAAAAAPPDRDRKAGQLTLQRPYQITESSLNRH